MSGSTASSAPGAPVPELVDRLAHLLKHAQLRLAGLTVEALAPFNVSGRELAVLLVIADQPPASQLQVANRMGVDRTTMVALIDELERKRLVERRPDPADRRRNVVALTRSGTGITQQAAAAAGHAEQEFLKPLSNDDAAAIRRALRVLAFPDEDPSSNPGQAGSGPASGEASGA
jgi:DNA-binding MarR family transcriptional regulator